MIEDDQQDLGKNIMNVSNVRDQVIKKDLGNNKEKNENIKNIKDEQTEKVNKLKNKNSDLIPYTIMTANIIQGNICDKPLLVLLDSGSNNSFIKYSSLPHNVCGK